MFNGFFNRRVTGLSVLAAVLLPAWAAASAPPLTPSPRAKRLLLLGDSNIFESLGRELQHGFETMGYDVYRRGKPTSGMARPDFFDWHVEGARLVERVDPDVVVIMFGGNDGQRLTPYPGTGERVIKWKYEHDWIAEYSRRIEHLIDVLGSQGAQVFVLSPTNRRPRIARERMRRVIYAQQMAVQRSGRATWVDTFTPSSDLRGSYLAFGQDNRRRRVPYRHNDGIHLTRAGAAALREHLVPAMMSLGLQPVD